MAGLEEQNRGLKHRLAKYEASPQQARYKYARQTAAGAAPRLFVRQTAAGAAPRPGRVDGNGEGTKHNWPAAKPTSVGRMREAGGAGVPFDGRNNGNNGHGQGNGKPVGCYNSRESAAFADRVLLF